MIRFAIYIVIGIGLLMLLTIISLKRSKENKTSIMLRIFANYVQLIGVALSFDIQYPKSINQLMVPFQFIGSATKTFLSFD